MAEYEITYSIRRDEEEIGFGSSGHWSDVDAALYALHTDVQRREWETERGMPDPEEVDSDGRS